MPHPTGKKEAGRARLLAGAGRSFRAFGYGGIGVDGIAKEAGVTSGAFYAHFRSKAAIFDQVVRDGLADLAAGIDRFRSSGRDWAARFIDFYVDDRRTCDVRQSCALQALAGEAARGDSDARAGFAAGFDQAVEALSNPAVASALDRDTAIALLAMLSGGVTIARAIPDPKQSVEVAEAVRRIARQIAGDAGGEAAAPPV